MFESAAAPPWVAALRPHQWTKNLLVFVPLVLAHVFTLEGWLLAARVFAAMCLASSSAYLINDILDRKADRTHTLKRHRPIAAGSIGVTAAAGVALLFAAASLLLSASLSRLALAAVGIYLGLTLTYSLWLKRALAVDVFVLTALYCLRVLIGGIATGITISPWTFSFSMFIFLSLALMKRYAELFNARSGPGILSTRRGYVLDDMPIIASFGVASATTAILVVALYVNGDDVRKLYSKPDLLWLICLVVLLWITRLWLLTNRGSMHEDPVLFAVRDPWSLLSVVAVGSVILISL
ncbi:MAG TPA: UbiA family prenyltransferase [Bryobacteraceae bacterium]|nr:UbiA family prenyltransferase [Bryobacteraceae bacterium]